MHAIVIDPTDRSLSWQAMASPPLGPGQVRIRVRATAVNRADLVQRAGFYDPPPGASPVLGLECAGTIEEIGAGAAGVSLGERVCALLSGGGYAEEVVCPAAHLLPIPEHLSFAEAAALPEVLTTAWLNLYREAGLQPGERVLLHAGASGVGTAAIQLCRRSGNPCLVTAGSDEKIDRCVALGAAAGLNRHTAGPALRDAVRAWSGGGGVDVILDPVGAGYLTENLASLAVGGRLILIGLMGGRRAEIDLGSVLVRRLRLVGSVLRSRSDAEKADILQGLRRDVWPAVAAGEIQPIIEDTLPLTAAHRAHEILQGNQTFGKLILLAP